MLYAIEADNGATVRTVYDDLLADTGTVSGGTEAVVDAYTAVLAGDPELDGAESPRHLVEPEPREGVTPSIGARESEASIRPWSQSPSMALAEPTVDVDLAREHPAILTAALTLVGYVLVVGTLYVGLPIYPEIGLETVTLLSHVIAVVNTITVVLLAAGWYWIRQGQVRKHRLAMTAAFVLIMLFLVLYLTKTGGGGRKDVVGSGPLVTAYLGMLAVHITLSVAAVPVVLYALVLGLTRRPAELRDTLHPRVGRFAAAAWILSLVLGITAYVLLNYVLAFEFVDMVLLPV